MADALVLVTPMTEREFGNVFAKLAMQLRWTDADAVAIKSYFDALKDLPLDALQASAATLAKEPGRKFFPTTAEWREVAAVAAREGFRKALPPAREQPWRVECGECDDTGWAFYECTGTDCGRKKKHQAPHRYVRACECRATNRTYQRHQQFGGGE